MPTRKLRIGIVTPAPPGSRKGNRVTALRWARLLRSLGHRVAVVQAYQNEPFDLLIALHARRSGASVERFHQRNPSRPIVVALTGTDLYLDLGGNRRAQRSLELADRLIVLQPLAIKKLPRRFRDHARVVHQSVSRACKPVIGSVRVFKVCVLAHLRPVKDPFRTALAVRRLPANSKVVVHHYGAALDVASTRRARQEMRINRRYHWHNEVPRSIALLRLAASRLLILTSKLEGGANVVSEAIALGVPILCSRIDGSVGILGADYPGLFPVGNHRALARLLNFAETKPGFYGKLRMHCARLRPLVSEAREKHALARLLKELRPKRNPTGASPAVVWGKRFRPPRS